MPMYYGVAPVVNQATSGSANTEVDGLFIAAGVRNVAISQINVLGKGAGLTALSGIVFRLRHWTTGSTGGTAITPKPRDPGMQASKATAAYTPTAGSVGGANHLAFGCGAAGPGGWIAENADAMPLIEGGSGDSLDLYHASGTVSLNFEQSVTIVE